MVQPHTFYLKSQQIDLFSYVTMFSNYFLISTLFTNFRPMNICHVNAQNKLLILRWFSMVCPLIYLDMTSKVGQNVMDSQGVAENIWKIW